MDITYPSIQSANQYKSDAIGILSSTPGPVSGTGNSNQTFSLCLYTNCQPPMEMTSCNYEIISIASPSLIGTVLGIDYGAVTPSVPEAPEEPIAVPDSANTERAKELAAKAEEFYASLADTYDTEAEKALDAEFSDLYAPSAARAHGFTEEERDTMILEEYLDKSEAKANELKQSGDICIRVGAGEIAGVMESILKAAAGGLSLEEALSAYAVGNNEENPYVREKSGSANADLFLINTASGEVTAAVNKGRTVLDNDLASMYADDEAVLRLADDLAAFIRYAMFSDVDDERTRAFLAHLVNKQAYADYDRYIQDLDGSADIQAVMNAIFEKLASAAGMFGDETEEDSEEIQPIEGEEEAPGDEINPTLPEPRDELKEIIGSIDF